MFADPPLAPDDNTRELACGGDARYMIAFLSLSLSASFELTSPSPQVLKLTYIQFFNQRSRIATEDGGTKV